MPDEHSDGEERWYALSCEDSCLEPLRGLRKDEGNTHNTGIAAKGEVRIEYTRKNEPVTH